jgi:hypothetical protein
MGGEEVETMIVGISGKAGAGKDTLSLFIAMHLYAEGVPSRRLALADSIKRIAKDLGWNGERDAVGRFALQRFGTELMRAKDSAFWIHQWEWSADARDDVKVWIVPDVRYRNEAEWVRAHKGILVRVTKIPSADTPSVLGTSSNAVGPAGPILLPDAAVNVVSVAGALLPSPATHASETDLDDWVGWDFSVVAAEGDLDVLWTAAGIIAREARPSPPEG